MPRLNVVTLCKITRIIRTDGVQFGFTTLDRDLEIDGLIYKANGAISPETSKKTIDLGADNLKLESILQDDGITEGDIIGGKFKNAQVVSAIINYLNPPTVIDNSVTFLFSGLVGETRTTDTTYVMEIRNLVSILNQGISVKASPICRWRFGGEECFNAGSTTTSLVTFTGSVAASANRKTLELNFAPTVSLQYGLITFTSGRNQGITATIEQHTANTTTIELLRSLPFSLEVGDTCEGHMGCAKTVDACKAYGNFINFGGFPSPTSESSGWMPGTDHLISSPLQD